MTSARDIHVAPISSKDARHIIKRYHYSGKVVNNSQLHLGVFLHGRCEGAMQFGPSMDKRKIQYLVSGTQWNGFIELNRMAFSERLPRNSESRALSVAFRMIRKNYPHIEWVISFADATQSGDGAIYRACGFVLTGVRKNNQIWVNQEGQTITRFTATKGGNLAKGSASMERYKKAGFHPLSGFQCRYIYFLYPSALERLTVPILPFCRIGELDAGMYRGKKISRPKQAMTGAQSEQRRGSADLDAPNNV